MVVAADTSPRSGIGRGKRLANGSLQVDYPFDLARGCQKWLENRFVGEPRMRVEELPPSLGVGFGQHRQENCLGTNARARSRARGSSATTVRRI